MDDVKQPSEQSVWSVLEKLCEEHQASMVCAWPHKVVLGVRGRHVQAHVPWGAHEQAMLVLELQALGKPYTSIGDAVVVRRHGPQVSMRVLQQEGVLSALASDTLQACMVLRKNMLVLGPHGVCKRFMEALLAEVVLPLWVGPYPPSHAVGLPSLDISTDVQTDAMALYAVPQPVLAKNMLCVSGVLAYLDANSLERGLIRLEAALQTYLEHPATPLDVMNAVDLVVCMGPTGEMEGMAELVWDNNTYRPQWLFKRGGADVAGALLPLNAPSDLDAYARIGGQALEQAWKALGSKPVEKTPSLDVPVFAQPLLAQPWVQETPEVIDIDVDGMSPVGWELEQPGASTWAETPQESDTSGYEEAHMAAHFGLAPPPKKG
jgi:hypothetical protein